MTVLGRQLQAPGDRSNIMDRPKGRTRDSGSIESRSISLTPIASQDGSHAGLLFCEACDCINVLIELFDIQECSHGNS